MTVEVHVEGLTEFRRALKSMDRDLPKGLRLAFNDAADIVVDEARPRVTSRSGRARRSVRVRSSQRFARVSGGGRRAPYYPWLDFGGRVGRGRSVHRPFLSQGRYIYKAFYRNRDEFTERLRVRLIGVAKAAGVEVS
jgi:hypothetical protein